MYYEINNCMYDTKLEVNSEIKFKEDEEKYKIISSNIVFAICTREVPRKDYGDHYQDKHTVYTIIDFWNDKRGAENLIFWKWVSDKKECDEMLERLTNWESEVSSRNCVDLKIEDIIIPKKNHE